MAFDSRPARVRMYPSEGAAASFELGEAAGLRLTVETFGVGLTRLGSATVWEKFLAARF